MAERDEPGVPEEEIQAEQRDGIGHEREHQGRVVNGRDRREAKGGDERSGQQDDPGQPHATAAFPKRPRGRITSTPMTIR